MAEKDTQQIKEKLTGVKGTLAIEGLYLKKEEEELLKKNITGELSDEEFEKKVMELVTHEK